MKIQFTCFAHTFELASKIEVALKEIGVQYETKFTDRVNSGVKRTRVVIGKNELAAVLQCLATNKDWTTKQVAKATNVSRATVSRISLGTHVLQQK